MCPLTTLGPDDEALTSGAQGQGRGPIGASSSSLHHVPLVRQRKNRGGRPRAGRPALALNGGGGWRQEEAEAGPRRRALAKQDAATGWGGSPEGGGVGGGGGVARRGM